MPTLSEMLARQGHPVRHRPHDEEHRLQVACVRWFRLQYPRLRHRLFAVPNGGRRDAVTGARLKAEGALAGVADLILLMPSRTYGALLIEMKTPRGRQSPAQREWAEAVTADGRYLYLVCRSLEAFRQAVRAYLTTR